MKSYLETIQEAFFCSDKHRCLPLGIGAAGVTPGPHDQLDALWLVSLHSNEQTSLQLKLVPSGIDGFATGWVLDSQVEADQVVGPYGLLNHRGLVSFLAVFADLHVLFGQFHAHPFNGVVSFFG